MNSANKDTQEQLLQFFYQIPYGLIRFNSAGQVKVLSACACSQLMPIIPSGKLECAFEILTALDKKAIDEIKQFDQSAGVIFENRRSRCAVNETVKYWFDLTAIKLSGDEFLLGLNDSTLLVEREEKIQQEKIKTAQSAAKLEMATGIIHDIGNAVTAVGIGISDLIADNTWQEIENIARVINLIKGNIDGIDGVLGENKGKALVTFLESIENSLNEKQESINSVGNTTASHVHHIQDIIRIQKQFAKDGEGAPKKPLDMMMIIYHAESILRRMIDAQEIDFRLFGDRSAFFINGDKTRMTQALINIIKNSCESIATKSGDENGVIQINITSDESDLTLVIQDNGIGFDAQTQEKLKHESFTTKAQGSGIGLTSVRSVIHSHHGTLSMHSDGVGKGCKTVIQLPLMLTSNDDEENSND